MYACGLLLTSMTDRRCSRQRQHSASANSESSYSGSANESSYSGSSDESSEESTRIIPDPPISWYPPGSLPSASSSTGSTHDTTAGIYKNNGYLIVSCNGGLNHMRAVTFSIFTS
ncbi:Rhamnogalacturonan I rhamnosyltransferase 1 [Camellia lanceoleosa]|uniref:Rhamnogalacturonan I rhamnosyltransferase 1 n=1 Tax=Camellia lanceoleosa TaxID=1840588 RepID=A0ACC0GVP2_9ERIC|nr:Rhamnogalacturonan I rhamnosyltransferase 1 [Camellia lanceoleosa]